MSYNQLHILILLDRRNLGGIETHVANLAKGLDNSGHSVTVVLMNNYGLHPVFDTDDFFQSKLYKLNGSIKSLYHFLKHVPTDVVHTHGYKAGIMGRLLCRLLGKTVVSTFHAGEKGSKKMQFYRWLDNLTATQSHCISVSEEISKQLNCSSRVIQNFVEPNCTVNPLIKAHQIAFVGRLSHEKGPDYFLNIAKSTPQGLFTIYGDGPMYEDIKADKPFNVSMMGQVESMESYWPNIKFLCITSRAEGLPLVALEAMSRGIPVVSFDVGGLSTLIQHNINGWLIPPESPQKFINTLHHVLQFKRRRLDLLAQNARKIISDNFSTTAVIPQIQSVYLKAVKGDANV